MATPKKFQSLARGINKRHKSLVDQYAIYESLTEAAFRNGKLFFDTAEFKPCNLAVAESPISNRAIYRVEVLVGLVAELSPLPGTVAWKILASSSAKSTDARRGMARGEQDSGADQARCETGDVCASELDELPQSDDLSDEAGLVVSNEPRKTALLEEADSIAKGAYKRLSWLADSRTLLDEILTEVAFRNRILIFDMPALRACPLEAAEGPLAGLTDYSTESLTRIVPKLRPFIYHHPFWIRAVCSTNAADMINTGRQKEFEDYVDPSDYEEYYAAVSSDEGLIELMALPDSRGVDYSEARAEAISFLRDAPAGQVLFIDTCDQFHEMFESIVEDDQLIEWVSLDELDSFVEPCDPDELFILMEWWFFGYIDDDDTDDMYEYADSLEWEPDFDECEIALVSCAQSGQEDEISDDLASDYLDLEDETADDPIDVLAVSAAASDADAAAYFGSIPDDVCDCSTYWWWIAIDDYMVKLPDGTESFFVDWVDDASVIYDSMGGVTVFVNVGWLFRWQRANLFTVNYRRRSLFMGLVVHDRRCVFSFSLGMFLPNYKAFVRKKSDRLSDLSILRKLKHKEKKLVKKKSKKIRWKCLKRSKSTKRFMARYARYTLIKLRLKKTRMVVRGYPAGARGLLREIFKRKKGDELAYKHGRAPWFISAEFYNKYEHTLTERAVKKRIKKKLTIKRNRRVKIKPFSRERKKLWLAGRDGRLRHNLSPTKYDTLLETSMVEETRIRAHPLVKRVERTRVKTRKGDRLAKRELRRGLWRRIRRAIFSQLRLRVLRGKRRIELRDAMRRYRKLIK